MSGLARKRLGRAALNGTGIAVFLFAVFPVYWMVATAFKPNDQIFTTKFIPFPSPPSLDHVSRVFTKGVAGHSIWQYLLNSLIVAVGAVTIGAVFALLAAVLVRHVDLACRARAGRGIEADALGLGWEGRMLLAGVAATAGLVPFAYAALAGYLWLLFIWEFLTVWLVPANPELADGDNA